MKRDIRASAMMIIAGLIIVAAMHSCMAYGGEWPRTWPKLRAWPRITAQPAALAPQGAIGAVDPAQAGEAQNPFLPQTPAASCPGGVCSAPTATTRRPAAGAVFQSQKRFRFFNRR